jgi:hypothetical protein
VLIVLLVVYIHQCLIAVVLPHMSKCTVVPVNTALHEEKSEKKKKTEENSLENEMGKRKEIPQLGTRTHRT